MLSDEDLIDALQAARSDRMMAFVHLERKLRETVHQRLEQLDEQSNYESWNAYYIGYINHTIAAAKGLGIDAFNTWEVPSHGRNHSLSDQFRDFTAAVDSYTMQVRLGNAEHRAKFAVRLSPEDKRKIRHFAEKIKTIIEKSGLSAEKREELVTHLNAFLTEVDRDRTRLEYMGAFVVGVAHIVGDAAKELDPLRPWIDSIARIFGKAQESVPKALPQAETKRIEPPKKPRLLAKGDDLDDDIPF